MFNARMETGSHCIRGSCDECHARKIRCVARLGSCEACSQYGRRCFFSPRSTMGRPRTSMRNSTHESSTKRLADTKIFDWSAKWNPSSPPRSQQGTDNSTDASLYNLWGNFTGQDPSISGANAWSLDCAIVQEKYQKMPHCPRQVIST